MCGFRVVQPQAEARTVRRSESPTMRILQILWPTDLERGVLHTPARGMRFMRSRVMPHGRRARLNRLELEQS